MRVVLRSAHDPLPLDPKPPRCTIEGVRHLPAHGFPGGPPTPPYGEIHKGAANSPHPSPVSSADNSGLPDPVSPPLGAKDALPPPATITAIAGTKTRVRRVLVRSVAVLVPIAVLSGVLVSRGGNDGQRSPTTTPDITAETIPNPTTQPNNQTPAPSSTPAGLNTFAQIPVDECANMIEMIGAVNPFPPGVLLKPGESIGLQASESLGAPTWVAELPEGFNATELVSDPRPPAPSAFRGVSDGTVLVFSPLDIANGSLLGIYRAANGELVWTAKLPPQVYPLSDSSRLYLIDHRSATQTNIAVVAPSRAQITGCYAATGSQVPRPSPLNKTAVAHGGALYVTFPVDGSGSRVESLSDTEMTTIAEFQPYPYMLHGVLQKDQRRVLVSSSGAQGALQITGYDLEADSVAFQLSGESLQAAPVPDTLQPASRASVAAIVASTSGLIPLDVRSSLIAGEHLVMFFGTNGAPLLAAVLDVAGTVRWRVGVVPEALPGSTLSPTHLYMAPAGTAANSGTRTAVVLDAATGEAIGDVDNLRAGTSLGTDLVGFSLWQTPQNEYAAIYDGGKKFATLGGAKVTNVEPIALTRDVVVVYAEVASRRLLVAYVLNPTAVEGPTS